VPLGVSTEVSLAAIGPVRGNVISSDMYGVHDRSTFGPATQLYLNSAAFAVPAAFTLGNSPRLFSQLRGFDTINWNGGLLEAGPSTTGKAVSATFRRATFFPFFGTRNTSNSSTMPCAGCSARTVDGLTVRIKSAASAQPA
jgi:hypothetical protein